MPQGRDQFRLGFAAVGAAAEYRTILGAGCIHRNGFIVMPQSAYIGIHSHIAASGTGVGGVAVVLAIGFSGNGLIHMAQGLHLIGHIAVTAGAGIQRVAVCGAGSFVNTYLIAVAQGLHFICHIAVTAGADVGSITVFGTGGQRNNGPVLMAGRLDNLAVGIAADRTGIGNGTVGNACSIHSYTFVAMCAHSIKRFLIALAAVADIDLITILGTACFHKFADRPAVGVTAKQALNGVGCGYGATGIVADNAERIIVDDHHTGIAVFDVTGIHICKVDGSGAAALGSQTAASGNKINAGIRAVFSCVVVAPQEHNIMACAHGVERIQPGRTAGIVAAALMDGHMAHNENYLAGIRIAGPGYKIGRCSGSTGAGLHIALVNTVDIVIFAGIHFTGPGVGIGVGAVLTDVGIVGSIGIERIRIGIHLMDLIGDGSQRTAVCVIYMVTAKHNQAGFIGKSLQKRIELGGFFMPVRGEENCISGSAGFRSVATYRNQRKYHHKNQQHR